MTNPASTAQKGRGPFAVLRRAKNVTNANDAERNALLGDAERLETWCANVVLGAIVLEAVVWASPLCPSLFKLGNFISDAAVAIGIYGEVRFGHVAGNIMKMRLAEAIERAAAAEFETEKLRKETSWRTITNAERGPLMESLRSSGPPASVRFSVMANDPESLHFAQQISQPFHFLGWSVGYSFESFNVGVMTGIVVPIEQENWLDEIKAVNKRARDALISANMEFRNGWPSGSYMQTGGGQPLPAPWASVYVGPKPMPQL